MITRLTDDTQLFIKEVKNIKIRAEIHFYNSLE